MSKTDKTDPWRVKLAREPHRRLIHHWGCDHVHCDADLDFVHRSNLPRRSVLILIGVRSYIYFQGYPRCTWECWYDTYSFRYGRKSDKHERHSMWYGPARAEERAKLGEAIKEYRGSGDIDDIEFDHGQHRHNTDWELD